MWTLRVLSILAFVTALHAADSIPSANAKDHVGETATVCGHVADSNYLANGSHLTFLNFDRPYPNHTFTAFVAADNRSKFENAEVRYRDKDICVTGQIVDYQGKPEIVLTDPNQITTPKQ
jgi:hypothetical protein